MILYAFVVFTYVADVDINFENNKEDGEHYKLHFYLTCLDVLIDEMTAIPTHTHTHK